MIKCIKGWWFFCQAERGIYNRPSASCMSSIDSPPWATSALTISMWPLCGVRCGHQPFQSNERHSIIKWHLNCSIMRRCIAISWCNLSLSDSQYDDMMRTAHLHWLMTSALDAIRSWGRKWKEGEDGEGGGGQVSSKIIKENSESRKKSLWLNNRFERPLHI
jgi:hypothetical protein